jgi:fluoride exporter
MYRLMAIAVAGAAGTLTRYALGGFVQRLLGAAFPWGTLVVNALGCLAFGVVWTAAQERGMLDAETRAVILVGFMGAFTTFSTFIAESGQLLSDRELLYGFGNVSLQVALGLAAFYVGQALGRAI